MPQRRAGLAVEPAARAVPGLVDSLRHTFTGLAVLLAGVQHALRRNTAGVYAHNLFE